MMYQFELFSDEPNLYDEFDPSDLCSAVPCDEDDLIWDEEE
jgi:hypothetical protein